MRDYSEKAAEEIDEEVKRIIDEAHEVAQKVLAENRPRLVHLAERLLAKDSLEGADLEAAFSEPLGSSPSPARY